MKLLFIALFPVGAFVPQCSCACCTLQLADCADARLCTPGKKTKCMVEKPALVPKCDTWLDQNFAPFDCKVSAIWVKHRKVAPDPKTIGHNQFCEEFCHGETENSGALCLENAVPTIAPPTCCPCSANVQAPAPPSNRILVPNSFLSVRCQPECCRFA